MSSVNSTSKPQNVKLTPFQRGLLSAFMRDERHPQAGLPATWVQHLKPASKRSFNLLINRGLIELVGDTYTASAAGIAALKGGR